MAIHTARFAPSRSPSQVTFALKRTMDVIGSIAGLLLLWPVFLVVSIAIRLDTPGPAFFRQTRVGQFGRPFQIYKFRSMTINAPTSGSALTVNADRRVTAVGAFLRRTKIDELPQFINVFAGDMSLVGPRPEVPEFVEFYSPEQRAVLLSMRPGMTDYAAILFRDESSLLEQDRDPIAVYRHKIMPIKFSHYERYSREISVTNDLRIILATVLLLIVGHVPAMLGIESELRSFAVRG